MMRWPCGSPSCWRVRSASAAATRSAPSIGPVISVRLCGSRTSGFASVRAARSSGTRAWPAAGGRRAAGDTPGQAVVAVTARLASGRAARRAPSRWVARSRSASSLIASGQPVAPAPRSIVTPGCSAVIVSSHVTGSGRSTPRSVMTMRGPAPVRPSRSRLPGPEPKPTLVMNSTRSTNVRRLWRTITMTSRQEAAISGAPPAPGRRTAGCAVVAADHGRVDVREPVELGGGEEAEVDAAGLEPVVEHLRHADHGVGGGGEDAVADGQRQAVRLRAERAGLVDQHEVRGVACRGRGSAAVLGRPMPTKQTAPSRSSRAAATRHHLVGRVVGRDSPVVSVGHDDDRTCSSIHAVNVARSRLIASQAR